MSTGPGSKSTPGRWAVGAATAVYAVTFPEDVQAVLAPVGVVLGMAQQLDWGAYLLLSVVAVCVTFRRTAVVQRPPSPDV